MGVSQSPLGDSHAPRLGGGQWKARAMGPAWEKLASGDGVQPCHVPAAALPKQGLLPYSLRGGHLPSPGLGDRGEVEVS